MPDARDSGALGRPQKTVSVSGGTRWSLFWLVVGVALALPVGLVSGGDVAVDYLPSTWSNARCRSTTCSSSC